MSILITLGFVLAGGTIACDHPIYELPQWLAVTLYSAAVIFFIIGMIMRSKKA